jgi:hypothetical protein
MATTQIGKAVQNRVDNGAYVVSSGVTHAESVGAAVERRWGLPPGVEAGFTEEQILWLSKLLETSGQKLREREHGYVAELADDVEPRAERDARAREALTIMVHVRSRVGDLLGGEGLQKYGLVEAPPTRPNALAEQMLATIKLFEASPTTVRDPLDSVFDTAVVAEKLRAAYTPLAEALEVVLNEERERQESMTARDEAIEEWAKVYQGVASILSGLFMLADRRDLSARLRPTTRRTIGRSGETPEVVTEVTPTEETTTTEETETPSEG